MSDDEELPSEAISQYFFTLDTSHQITNGILKLSVKIPVVLKDKFSLHKVQTFPARKGSSLVLTKVPFQFLANSTDFFTFFSSLDNCIAFQPYLCEPETSLHTNSDDCLTHTFIEREIMPEKCEIMPFESTHLMIVQLTSDDYFYYTPSEDFIEITCDGSSTMQKLTESGVLHLGKECTAKTPKFQLIPTFVHQLWSKNVKFLDAGFSREELEKFLRGEKNLLSENVFYENLAKLNFKERKDLKEVPLVVVEGSFWDVNKFYILGGILAALLVILCAKRCIGCGCCC